MINVNQQNSKLWTSAHVAEYLNVDNNTPAIWRLQERDYFNSKKIGRHVYYEEKSVREVIKQLFLKEGPVSDIDKYLRQPLWTTEKVAGYFPIQARTVKQWRSTNALNLRPIYIGRIVRYCPIFVKEIADQTFMRPY